MHERRRSPRHPVGLPVRVDGAAGIELTHAIDVCADGLAVTTGWVLPVGSPVGVEVTLPKQGTLRLEARVARTGPGLAGLALLPGSEDAGRRWSSFVAGLAPGPGVEVEDELPEIGVDEVEEITAGDSQVDLPAAAPPPGRPGAPADPLVLDASPDFSLEVEWAEPSGSESSRSRSPGTDLEADLARQGFVVAAEANPVEMEDEPESARFSHLDRQDPRATPDIPRAVAVEGRRRPPPPPEPLSSASAEIVRARVIRGVPTRPADVVTVTGLPPDDRHDRRTRITRRPASPGRR